MQQTLCNPHGNHPQYFLPGFLENKRLSGQLSSEQRQTMHTQKKISPMLKQRLKADVTEQEIPCGLSKGQGYLWRPEKMVTSLGNFKWNVQFCLLKGWLFLFSSWHRKNLQGFSRSCGGDLLQCSLRGEGMEIPGVLPTPLG